MTQFSLKRLLQAALTNTLVIANAGGCTLAEATQDDLDSEAPYDDEVALAAPELRDATITTAYSWAVQIRTSASTCSAVALTDRVLLTAAHCVDHLGKGWHDNALSVYRAVNTSTTVDNVKRIFSGRAYVERPSSDSIINDIAVLVTDSSMNQGYRARIYNGSFDHWNAKAQGGRLPAVYDSFMIAGFGLGSSASECSKNPLNHKRAGTLEFFGSNANRVAPASLIYAARGPSFPCSGDSGAPAFVRKSSWDLVFATHQGRDGDDDEAYEVLIRPKWKWIAASVARSGVVMTCEQFGQDYSSQLGRFSSVVDSDKHLRCRT
jgi:hypothetical protein